jgi:methylated-DNA-[protein]-cysteine S-methyltransferase
MPCYAIHPSPVGPLLAVAAADALVGLYFQDEPHAPVPGRAGCARDDAAPIRAATSQLDEYFAGLRDRFDLPMAPIGTPFQQAVWTAIASIPYGETITYGELARRIGRPGHSRAVGVATGRNPLSIVVPCHRVVGADGALTGYAGGLDRKRRLLALEAGKSPTG